MSMTTELELAQRMKVEISALDDTQWYLAKPPEIRLLVEALEVAMCNSPAIPDGWQLVPVEPTLKMIKTGANAASTGMLIPGMYRAMLASAPHQEGK